jgi:hypothetical protein
MKLLALGVCLVSVAVSAQQPQSPPRDAALRPTVGTATIAGTVVADEPNGRPLRRVTLQLNPAGSGATLARMTTTDDQGRFAFARLPGGNYNALRATKPGYLPTSYGQKRVGGLGVPLSIAEGQRMTVTVKMLRGGVITGMLTDETGKPAVQVQVQASQIRMVNGERQPAQGFGNSTSTDDRGIYRIFGLSPGDYLVTATPRMTTSGEVRPVTQAEVQWAEQQLQPAGAAAGGGPSANGATAAPKPAQAVAYSPVYYPGTTESASATAVAVAAGQEATSIDFRVQLVPSAKIEGIILDPEGQPAQNVQMNVVPKLDAWSTGSIFLLDAVLLNRPQIVAGKFTIPSLRPGDYTIAARAAPRGAAPSGPAGAGTPGSGRGQGPAAPLSLWAMTDVTVAGVDQSNIVLRLEPGMTLTGRVGFEGDVLKPPADLSRVSLRLTTAPNPTGMTVSVNPATAQVNADGSFTFTGITPGKYLLSAAAPAATAVSGVTWQVKSLMIGRVDCADTPIEMKPGDDVSGAVLTFTDKASEVSGTLSDATGKPTSEFSVILFPVDKAMWSTRSRRFRAPVRAAVDGKFKFSSLPPGEYYLAALTDFEPSDVSTPAFLEQVVPSAVKITIGEGEKKTQDLKLAGG